MVLQFEREVEVYESYHVAQAELDKQFHDDVISMIMKEYGH